jgi:hypothetical protein
MFSPVGCSNMEEGTALGDCSSTIDRIDTHFHRSGAVPEVLILEGKVSASLTYAWD